MMMTPEKQSSARNVGRPHIDDRIEILAHFSARIALGQSVSQAASSGLRIWRYTEEPVGKFRQPVLIRTITPRTLERRYRDILAEEERNFAVITQALQGEATRFVGIARPKAPLFFSHDANLRRGRPKKMRSR